MSITALKVKIKSLAAESRIISKEEARLVRIQRKLRKNRSGQINSLHRHRKNEVGVEARRAQLAYGFLRGRNYSILEMPGSKGLDWTKLRDLVARFANSEDVRNGAVLPGFKTENVQTIMQKFAEWQDDAVQRQALKKPARKKRTVMNSKPRTQAEAEGMVKIDA